MGKKERVGDGFADSEKEATDLALEQLRKEDGFDEETTTLEVVKCNGCIICEPSEAGK